MCQARGLLYKVASVEWGRQTLEGESWELWEAVAGIPTEPGSDDW